MTPRAPYSLATNFEEAMVDKLLPYGAVLQALEGTGGKNHKIGYFLAIS